MPRRKKPGTKTLLTNAFIKRVETLAAQGLTQRQIAIILNVGACTLSIWKSKKGQATEKFQKAIARGEAKGVEIRLKRIEKAAKKGSWQADAWVLERRNREQFGKQDTLRVGDPDGKPLAGGTTVIAPTVVFIQPKKEELTDQAIDITGNDSIKQLPNGLPNGNGKHS